MAATIADLRERFDAFADPVAYPDPVVERADHPGGGRVRAER